MNAFGNKNIFIETDDVGNLYWSNANKQLHRLNGPAIEYIDGKKSYYVKGKLLNENQFNKLKNNLMKNNQKITKTQLIQLIKEVVGEYRTKGALGKKNLGQPVVTGKKAKNVEVYFEDATGNREAVADGLNSITGMKFDFITSTWPRTKSFLEKEFMITLGDAALSARIGQSVFDEIEKAKENELDDMLTINNNVIVFYLENNELKARTEGSKMAEELVGNQKKLDKTGDGKLTAKDFEMLRKSKK
jgi:hypothetical protein